MRVNVAQQIRGTRDGCGRWTRRRFVQGVAAGGVMAGLGNWTALAWARQGRVEPAELRGTNLDLTIGETPVNITGAPRIAQTINGSLPGPLLRLREGDTVTLRVRNTLNEDASIHWHGLILPANMDGVPGLSFHGIHPGETYTYRFPLKQHGTYWYHSHSGFQEQLGVYAPIVIEPREPEPVAADREHVVLLSDWTDEDPERVFRKLKKESDYYNFRQRTLVDFVRDVRAAGWKATLEDRQAWAAMRMSAADLADVTGATYTYLMNGQPPAANWTALFAPGERVRLRFINGSAMTYFDVRIPGVKLTVVAADGQPVRPVDRRRVPNRRGGDLRRHRRTERRGGLHHLRPGPGSHRIRGRDAGGASRTARASAVTRSSSRADDGRHGTCGALRTWSDGAAGATTPPTRMPDTTWLDSRPWIRTPATPRPRPSHLHLSVPAPVNRHPSERNPLVDMQATMPDVETRRPGHRPPRQRSSRAHLQRPAQHVRRSGRP